MVGGWLGLTFFFQVQANRNLADESNDNCILGPVICKQSGFEVPLVRSVDQLTVAIRLYDVLAVAGQERGTQIRIGIIVVLHGTVRGES